MLTYWNIAVIVNPYSFMAQAPGLSKFEYHRQSNFLIWYQGFQNI